MVCELKPSCTNIRTSGVRQQCVSLLVAGCGGAPCAHTHARLPCCPGAPVLPDACKQKYGWLKGRFAKWQVAVGLLDRWLSLQ